MSTPPLLDFRDAARIVEPLSGQLEAGRLTLFSVFRDEAFFAPAFFQHYRRLGVEQFVIVDDRSEDSTREFLHAQPDCVTLACTYRYGDWIRYRDPTGTIQDLRAGIYLKIALPQAMAPDAYSLYVDADEFMILPPAAPDLPAVIHRLKCDAIRSVAASIVEFFPSTVAELRAPLHPESFCDLVGAYPWFQPEPLVEVDGVSLARLVNPSKSTQLFERCGIRARRPGFRGLIGRRKPPRKSPRHKTPLMLRSAASYLTGTHDGNVPPSGDVLLTIAHFVFTFQFADKIGRARAWRSHARGSDKYDHYLELLRRMDATGASFLDDDSKRFASAEQLLACGLMKW